MKKYLLLGMLGCVLALSSCSKDESKDTGGSEGGGGSEEPKVEIVTVTAAGALETTVGTNYSKMSDVKIVGPLNIKDCIFISSQMTSLSRLDLSKAVFEANTLPDNAFNASANIDENAKYATFSEIVLPENLEIIGTDAFYACVALKRVGFPTGLRLMGESAFSKCASLDNVTLPAGLEEIRNTAFYQCTSLVNITLPKDVEKLGDYVFDGCVKLVAISIPSKITYVSEGLFARCAALKTVNLPDDLKDIYKKAFEYTGLETITLPAKFETINRLAFYNSTSLKEVICKSTLDALPVVLEGAFDDTPSNKTLKVPAARVDAYKASVEWNNNFTTIIAIPAN